MPLWYLVLVMNGHMHLVSTFHSQVECVKYHDKHPLKLALKRHATMYDCTTSLPR
jgi:hypothetical protein